jgi:hypothetical protein
MTSATGSLLTTQKVVVTRAPIYSEDSFAELAAIPATTRTPPLSASSILEEENEYLRQQLISVSSELEYWRTKAIRSSSPTTAATTQTPVSVFGTPATPRTFLEGLRQITFSASREEEEADESSYTPQKSTGLHRRASAKVESWSPFGSAALPAEDEEDGLLLLTSKSHSSDKDEASLDDNDVSSPRLASPDAGEESNSLYDRGAWLVGLLILQSFSSFIIKNNEAMLQRHAVIVRFLTMLVGAGGNAGNQASVRYVQNARMKMYAIRVLSC